ncbi:MAG: hypothetical protein AAGM67_06465, partial [Bacteroidota bacterium]
TLYLPVPDSLSSSAKANASASNESLEEKKDDDEQKAEELRGKVEAEKAEKKRVYEERLLLLIRTLSERLRNVIAAPAALQDV